MPYNELIAERMSLELGNFCKANDLPYLSADELVCEPLAKPHQQWIVEFLICWFRDVEENEGEESYWVEFKETWFPGQKTKYKD